MAIKQERADRQRDELEEDRRAEALRKEEGLLEAAVADAVMLRLGRPPDFLRAGARSVRAGRYRVNVFAGPHAGSARVAHSFFVEADGDGRVLASSPAVARLY